MNDKRDKIIQFIEKSRYLFIYFIGILFLMLICHKAKATEKDWQRINEFKTLLYESGIKHKELVFAQCMYESGWLTNKNTLERNNVFGFRYKGKWKEFKDLNHALEYYKNYQEKVYFGGDYLDALIKAKYNTNPNYKKKVLDVYNYCKRKNYL